MLKLIFNSEEDLFKSQSFVYSKEKRVWIFVFLSRIIDLEEFQIYPKICYEASLFLLKNPEILDILFINNEIHNSCSAIEIEKSKFSIKILKHIRDYLTNEEIENLLSISHNM